MNPAFREHDAELDFAAVLHTFSVHADTEAQSARFRSLDCDQRRGKALTGRQIDREVSLRQSHTCRRIEVNVLDGVGARVNDRESARVSALSITLEFTLCGGATIRQHGADFDRAAGTIFGHESDEEARLGARLHVSYINRNGGGLARMKRRLDNLLA